MYIYAIQNLRIFENFYIKYEIVVRKRMITQESSNRKYKNRKFYKPPPQEDSKSNFKKLIIVIIISFTFITGQFIGGYISGSISVISDAFHLVTDLVGFLVSFIFIWFSKKKPNDIMSFGYHRMELIGALGNLFIIWGLAGFLIYEATMRIVDREFVQEPLAMLIVAAGGLPINIIMYFILHSGEGHSHGLMGQACGEQYNTEENNISICGQVLCEDVQCLINNQFLEHCHKQKIGENTQQIHKHKKKVQIEGNKIIRPQSPQQIYIEDMNIGSLNNLEAPHPHSNCKDHHHEGQHNHNHTEKKAKDNPLENHQHNHEGHDHSHDPCRGNHNHQNGHAHDHNHDEPHHHESISMKAAILHALSDVIQSIGLLISSLIIFFFGSHFGQPVKQWNNWHFLDPISTYIFTIIVIVSTWPITKNCYYLIMQSTPAYIDHKKLAEEISEIEGVVDVHDLHIWDLRPGKTILIAHVFSKKGQERSVLKNLTDLSRKKRIYHSTFQVEEEDWKDHQEYILCEHDIH